MDGILVIAPEWYDNHTRHDDPVSKRAARIALASDLGVPVQYLKPKQQEGERIRGGTDPEGTKLRWLRNATVWFRLTIPMARMRSGGWSVVLSPDLLPSLKARCALFTRPRLFHARSNHASMRRCS